MIDLSVLSKTKNIQLFKKINYYNNKLFEYIFEYENMELLKHLIEDKNMKCDLIMKNKNILCNYLAEKKMRITKKNI